MLAFGIALFNSHKKEGWTNNMLQDVLQRETVLKASVGLSNRGQKAVHIRFLVVNEVHFLLMWISVVTRVLGVETS